MSYHFEIHLTINALPQKNREKFEQFCQSLGGKAVLIELPKGEYTEQPMFTLSKKAENLLEILAFIDTLKPQFTAQDFTPSLQIIRTKIEIPANQTQSFLTQYPNTQGYYEWHGKVDFLSRESLAVLQQFANHYELHLSKNALKNLSTQRFLTIRHHLKDKEKFYHQIESIAQIINQNPHLILLKSQAECCIFDDKIALDKGWIPL